MYFFLCCHCDQYAKLKEAAIRMTWSVIRYQFFVGKPASKSKLHMQTSQILLLCSCLNDWWSSTSRSFVSICEVGETTQVTYYFIQREVLKESSRKCGKASFSIPSLLSLRILTFLLFLAVSLHLITGHDICFVLVQVGIISCSNLFIKTRYLRQSLRILLESCSVSCEVGV